jgi:peptidoglycan hydrolase-like protein with peptidoglycan-binding domain
MKRFWVVLAAGLALSPMARADGVALLIVNDSYSDQAAPRGTAPLRDMQGVLDMAGFEILSGQNLTAEEMRAQLGGLQAQLATGDATRVIVVLGGLFAQSRSGTWLMGIDTGAPGLAMADGDGLRLDTVMEVIASAPEGALLWLLDDPARADFGAGLQAGLPPRLAVPQDVGVVRGPGGALAQGLRATLRPGALVSDVVDNTRGLSGAGTISPLVPFLPVGYAPVARADRRAWATAQEDGSEAALQAYLDIYPNGLHAQDARAALDALRNSPDRIEDALALTRDERRAIQRDLQLLGFYNRGLDGLFGPGTRAGISAWQTREGLTATGFLTRDQVFALAQAGARRAAEIEEEERARRAAREAADRAFWDATGAGGDEIGLRAYLDRYPEGVFAALARERLAVIDTARQDALRARDLAAWRAASQAGTVAAFETYLAEWPEGEFAAEASRRIAALTPPPPDPIPGQAEAQAREAALGLTPATRRLIELRLRQMGYATGPVDGEFDIADRDAIAQAQERFGLRPTGYVTQDFVTMLLNDAFRRIFD